MGKGNIKRNRHRRQKNNKQVKKQDLFYEMIDGNFTHYPVGWCAYHKGYLTKNCLETHRCLERKCIQYREFEE